MHLNQLRFELFSPQLGPRTEERETLPACWGVFHREHQGDAVIQEYGEEVARRLLALIGDTQSMELHTDGVCMANEWVDTARMGADWLNWTPQCALVQSSRQVCELLPIPFSGRELAAFMLCPVAGALLEILGKPGQLDGQALADALGGVQDGRCRHAVEDAYSHLARAVAQVGTKDTDALWFDEQCMADDYDQKRNAARARLGIASVSGHGLSDAEYTQRIAQVKAEMAEMKAEVSQARERAETAEVYWLRRMTLALFEGELQADNAATSAVPQAAPRRVMASQAQDAAILNALVAAGHDPKALPRNTPGKRGAKATARDAVLVTAQHLFVDARSVRFDKGWERLRSQGDIINSD